MTAQELLNTAINGDIILYKGKGLTSSLIRYFDNAKYTHVGLVWCPEKVNHKLTLDMWTSGLTCLPLKRRASIYDEFCIIRPNRSPELINNAIDSLLYNWDGTDVKYDYMILLRIAIYKKLKLNVSMGRGNKDICSELIQGYFGMIEIDSYANNRLITPEDFIRSAEEAYCKIIYQP